MLGVCRVILTIFAVIVAIAIKKGYDLIKPLPLPKLELDTYWGEGERPESVEIKEPILSRIIYKQSVIDDLNEQLNRTYEFPTPLEGTTFDYGFNSNKLKELVTFWRDDYLPRWRSREVYLSQFPHFTQEIQGLRLHYLHLKISDEVKKKKTWYPVILLHGWPGSIREFYELIPKLDLGSDENDFVFDIVAPSLPGYGFSQGSSKKDFGPAQIAIVLRNLMISLGYDKFFIQGGDWGSIIGNNMATIFQDNVLGYHANVCFVNTPISNLKLIAASVVPSMFMEKKHESYFFPLVKRYMSLLRESGYFHLQATKPDTIGAVLTDNPIGLAAYLLEKFSYATNPNYVYLEDGGLEKKYSLDALLDNIMIYYLTNSITTAQRIYAEGLSKSQLNLKLDRVPTKVPTAIANFEHDISPAFESQITDKFTNLLQVTYHKDAGHFAALEVPDVLYRDFIEFVKKADKIIKK